MSKNRESGLITVHKTLNGGYEVEAYNGVSMGMFYMEVDGYYVFAPELRGGYWPAHMMRAIADELDSINAEWDKTVKEALDNL